MKTVNDLRIVLFDAIEKLQSQEMKAEDVRSLSSLARNILGTVRVELEYAKLKGLKPTINAFLTDGSEVKN